MTRPAHLTRGFDRLVRVAALVWGVALILGHSLVAHEQTWVVAAVFSILMNVTYPVAAWRAGDFRVQEHMVAALLIAMSVLGLVMHPLILVFAIAAHGLWDLAKHLGVGVPFFRWYTLGCVVVDLPWAGILFWLWYSSVGGV